MSIVGSNRILLWLSCSALMIGCPDKDDSGDGVGDTDTKVDATASIVPAGDEVPLSFVLKVESDEPVRVVATWNGKTVDFGASAAVQALPLVGFHFGSTTTVKVELVGEDGDEAVHEIDVTTPDQPTRFPTIETRFVDPARVQPGYTLVAPRPAHAQGRKDPDDYVLFLDEAGEIVWIYAPVEPITDATLLDNGNLLVQVWSTDGSPGGSLAEINLLGEEVQRWTGNLGGGEGHVVDATGFHHEGRPTPWGTYITLTKEPLQVEDYPASYTDPQETDDEVVGADVIVEFDATGAIARTWDMADYLDPHRIGFMSLSGSSFDGLPDWTHANAVTVDPSDGGVVVSLRNQSAIVKFQDQELVWILGNHDNWPEHLRSYLFEPAGDGFAWFYYQHDPDLSDDGKRIVVFDNGVERTMPLTDQAPLPTTERYSRVVEYTLGEGTVTQNWEFVQTNDGTLFSEFAGGTEYLPNGNVLACYGYLSRIDGQPISDMGLGNQAVRIVEIAPGDTPEAVFDVQISTTQAAQPAGYSAYRAERFPSLYPQHQADPAR